MQAGEENERRGGGVSEEDSPQRKTRKISGKSILKEAENLDIGDGSIKDVRSTVEDILHGLLPGESKIKGSLTKAVTIYVDDLYLVSTSSEEKMKELGITSESLYRKENCPTEKPGLFHLNFLNRLLFCLEEGNLLISASKVNILCQKSEHIY